MKKQSIILLGKINQKKQDGAIWVGIEEEIVKKLKLKLQN